MYLREANRNRSLPYHQIRNVHLRRPDESDNPSDECPSEKQVQQEDRQRVPLAVGERDDRRQKIKEESEAQKWRKQKWEKESYRMHICLLGPAPPLVNLPAEIYA